MKQDESINVEDRVDLHQALLEKALMQPGIKEVMEVYKTSQSIYDVLLGLHSLEETTVVSSSDSSTESL